MIWPKYKHVYCTGFSEALLPLIHAALRANDVIWGESRESPTSDYSKFEWMGAKWEIISYVGVVSSVALFGELPVSEELTMLILSQQLA